MERPTDDDVCKKAFLVSVTLTRVDSFETWVGLRGKRKKQRDPAVISSVYFLERTVLRRRSCASNLVSRIKCDFHLDKSKQRV